MLTHQKTPTGVVITFHEALKNEDYGKAYDQIYTFFSDKEGYVGTMKNTSEKLQTRLISYKVLGTQIFKYSAIVVVELQTDRNINGNTEKTITKQQFDLKLFENKWKIIKGRCIENCPVSSEFEVKTK